MARGPPPTAYSTARVLEVPTASLAGEQPPVSDTAASDSVLILAPKQQVRADSKSDNNMRFRPLDPARERIRRDKSNGIGREQGDQIVGERGLE